METETITVLSEPAREKIYYMDYGKYIDSIMDQLPAGILHKSIPGIGATSLELFRSQRNVIVVSPLISILKSKMSSEVLTVHGEVPDLEKIVKEYIKRRDDTGKFYKIHTTGESLRSLTALLDGIGIDWVHKFHFVIDEYDLMQLQSDFRDRLAEAFDFYKMFDRKNRTCVSATHYPFSDPVLQDEPVSNIVVNNAPVRSIELIMTNNTIDSVLKILNDTTEQVCIFIDSLNWINSVIPRMSHDDVAIYCGNNSRDKAGKFFNEYSSKPTARVCFFTSAYFVGCDILISPNLISVSDPATFGLNGLVRAQLVQIHGRFRHGIMKDYIISSFNKGMSQSRKSKDTLISEATQKLNVFKTLLKNQSDRNQQNILRVLKHYGENHYVRIDINGCFVINYLLIDSILIRNEDNLLLYSGLEGVERYLHSSLDCKVIRNDLNFDTDTAILSANSRNKLLALQAAIIIIDSYLKNVFEDPNGCLDFNLKKYRKHIIGQIGLVRDILELYKYKRDLEWLRSSEGDIDKLARDIDRASILGVPEYNKVIKRHLPVGARLTIPELLKRMILINQKIKFPMSNLSLKTCRKLSSLFCKTKTASIGSRKAKGVQIMPYDV